MSTDGSPITITLTGEMAEMVRNLATTLTQARRSQADMASETPVTDEMAALAALGAGTGLLQRLLNPGSSFMECFKPSDS